MEALSLPEIAITESDEVPAPTPGLLTKTTYELLNMPFVAISAGLEVEPKTSYISLKWSARWRFKRRKRSTKC